MGLGLLIIRLVVGGTVSLHGLQKFTTKIQGHGVSGARQMCEGLGLRPVALFAFLAASSELFGGMFLAAGLLTPFAAAAVIGMMFTAVFVVHLNNGYFIVHGGFEYPFVLGCCAAGIADIGPGRFSLDAAFNWSMHGSKWFAVAVGIGLVSALLTWARSVAGKKAVAPNPA